MGGQIGRLGHQQLESLFQSSVPVCHVFETEEFGFGKGNCVRGLYFVVLSICR